MKVKELVKNSTSLTRKWKYYVTARQRFIGTGAFI